MGTFAEEVVQEALSGQTLAAADRILTDPRPGGLVALVGQAVDAGRGRWDATDAAGQRRLVEFGLRLGFNLAGRDALSVGYGAEEVDQAFRRVADSFVEGDQDEAAGAVIRSVAGEVLADMKSVNAGDSLPGLMAERVEGAWKGGGRAFLELFRQQLRGGVYWAMTDGGLCKFGNDFARGLEYLRHIGFCQVSTNPVLAARAFEEDPRLVEAFREEAARHADWVAEPDRHGDAMAMSATLIALWPNLAVFRPLALHTNLMDYVVSFQLNPNLADQVADSLADARAAYRSAADFLAGYDRGLGLGARAGAVRPNIVFKVAASSEAARDITRALNAEGIGTNNTVVYTVGQEVQLILDAFEGKAYAVKAGNGVTRTYETNMGGRLVSHLREVEAEKIFAKVTKKLGEARAAEHLMTLARALNVDRATLDRVGGSFVDRVRAICAFKFLKSLAHKAMIEIAEAAGLKQAGIETLEQDLRKAGTLVARRVYRVFYGPESRPRWVAYLQRRYDLSQGQAETVLNSMDVLPASKRIPEDTYHTLGYPNFCNTEFPYHARAVQMMAETEGFRLEAFRGAILQAYDPGVTKRLNRLPDFRLAYDLTPDMRDFLLNEVGISEVADWGTGGIQPEEWRHFGSVKKTVAEFRAAYDAFVVKCVGIAREAAVKRS